MKTSSRTLFFCLGLLTAAGLLPAFAAPLPESQKIDALLAKDWAKNHLKPNRPATDVVLVRRLYLDVAGRIPTLEETRRFLESAEPDKRAKLIDELLAGDGWTSHMFNYWADLLRMTENVRSKINAQAYADFVKRSLKDDQPYDQFVREMITSSGGVWDSNALGFYTRDDNRLDHLAYATQVFL